MHLEIHIGGRFFNFKLHEQISGMKIKKVPLECQGMFVSNNNLTVMSF